MDFCNLVGKLPCILHKVMRALESGTNYSNVLMILMSCYLKVLNGNFSVRNCDVPQIYICNIGLKLSDRIW